MTTPTGLPGPVSKQTLAGQATEVLRELLLRGLLSPGERLNEADLATALGISRAPLREAIQRLANEGLVTSVNHRGSFVRTFSVDSVRELYEVRIALETFAVRQICLRGEMRDIEALSDLLDETEGILYENAGSEYPRDADFHQQIIVLSGNKRLLEMATALHRQIALVRVRSGRSSGRVRPAYVEHANVVAAIRARDADRAASALAQHIQASLDYAVSLLERVDDKARESA